MHASIVVLSALVAVSTAQIWAGRMPMNPHTGTPMDEPSVAAAKHFHANAHANAAMRSGALMRYRREASAAPETPEALQAEEPSKDKRAVLIYNGLGSAAYMPTAYAGTHWGFWRKRRDLSAEEAPEEPAEVNREKRQMYLRNFYGHPWGIWRKKRDLSAEEAPEEPAEVNREKRQMYLRTVIGHPWGIWRKKRDAAEEDLDEPTDAIRQKRQFLMHNSPFYFGNYGFWRKKRDLTEEEPQTQTGYGYGGWGSGGFSL